MNYHLANSRSVTLKCVAGKQLVTGSFQRQRAALGEEWDQHGVRDMQRKSWPVSDPLGPRELCTHRTAVC